MSWDVTDTAYLPPVTDKRAIDSLDGIRAQIGRPIVDALTFRYEGDRYDGIVDGDTTRNRTVYRGIIMLEGVGLYRHGQVIYATNEKVYHAGWRGWGTRMELDENGNLIPKKALWGRTRKTSFYLADYGIIPYSENSNPYPPTGPTSPETRSHSHITMTFDDWMKCPALWISVVKAQEYEADYEYYDDDYPYDR
jgi:hypothetical protein